MFDLYPFPVKRKKEEERKGKERREEGGSGGGQERGEEKKGRKGNTKFNLDPYKEFTNQLIPSILFFEKNSSCIIIRIGTLDCLTCVICLCKRSCPVGVSKVILKIIMGASYISF